MARYCKTYASTLEAGNEALDDVLRLLSENGVDESVRRAVSLAISEVFTNAVVHGNGGDPSKTVSLELLINESRISADITDQGEGGVHQIDARQPSAETDEGGRGIDLINHFADACSFSDLEGGGLKVSLEFDRKEHATVR